MPPALCRIPSFAGAALAALALGGLAGCSGGVSPSPNVVDATAITILPATAVLYSGLPTEFVISGGTGSYVITSSNQAIVPVSGAGLGHRLIVYPNPVLQETTVTLTVRDTGTTPQATATLTVRPGTVNNEIRITPTGANASACTPAICSGGDAEVQVTISQGGIPLGARGVRFDVVSGNAYRFITTAPGVTPELLELSTVINTDETGKARVRIRVQPLVPSQTALMQVTDVGSGAYQRVSFAIAQFTGNNPAFFTVPSGITFRGPFVGQCASSGQADIAIFGGSPPYNIVNSFVGFFATPQVVSESGGRFTLSLTSSAGCATNAPIAITDSTGRTITVTLNNVEGTATAPPTAVSLFPPNFALSCSFGATIVSASLTAAGGAGTYSAGSTHPRVLVTVAGSTVTVQRRAGDPMSTNFPTTGVVSVTDGLTSDTSTFTVPANCP